MPGRAERAGPRGRVERGLVRLAGRPRTVAAACVTAACVAAACVAAACVAAEAGAAASADAPPVAVRAPTAATAGAARPARWAALCIWLGAACRPDFLILGALRAAFKNLPNDGATPSYAAACASHQAG